jgi:hypothetical protein
VKTSNLTRNVVFSSYLIFNTVDNVQKHSDLEIFQFWIVQVSVSAIR